MFQTLQKGLNEQSSVPLYHQLRDLIRQALDDGYWKPTDRLPTEDAFCQHYDVSKTTVRQALNALVIEGRLRRKRGQGTFVAEPVIDKGPIQLTSFSEEMRRRGYVSMSRILELKEIRAAPQIAQDLEIKEGQSVYAIKRLRFGNEEPMAIQTAVLPARFFPGLLEEDLVGSLYSVLEQRYGVIVTSAVEVYQPVLLSKEDCQVLRMSADHPLGLKAERRSEDQRGRRVEFVSSLLRGDRYRISIRLARGGSGNLAGMR